MNLPPNQAIHEFNERVKIESMDLIEFLELIHLFDFRIRIVSAKSNMRGVEVRAEVLRGHIERLKKEKIENEN